MVYLEYILFLINSVFKPFCKVPLQNAFQQHSFTQTRLSLAQIATCSPSTALKITLGKQQK